MHVCLSRCLLTNNIGIQTLAVQLFVAINQASFEDFPHYPGLKKIMGTSEILQRLVDSLSMQFKGPNDCIACLQEFRGDISELQSIENMHIVYGDPPTETHPTVAILVKGPNFRVQKVDDIKTIVRSGTTLPSIDGRRIVCALVTLFAQQFIVVSFHGDVGTPGNSINETVAMITQNCKYPIYYAGDYQGGKKGADESIFAGVRTDKVGTREPPHCSLFGANQGVKNWTK